MGRDEERSGGDGGGAGGSSFSWRPPPSLKLNPWMWPVLAILLVALVAAFTGRSGIVEIDDREVAVIVNYLTGGEELIATPGYRTFMPVFAQAFKFDKSPNKFLMEGDQNVHANHVRKLTVRADDGSNFWFETLEIQYQLIVAAAPKVLHDSGPGDAFKTHWVRAFARSILRDEFGRFSAAEVADPSSYAVATQRATERLNEVLAQHGVEVVQIITPKPKFEQRYEQAIEDRKVANQEVERLKIEAQQLKQERDRRLADIERDLATKYEQLLGTLEGERIGAEREQVRVEKEADAYRIAAIAEGEAKKQRLLRQAAAREEQGRKESEGLRAKVDALAESGDILVREALAEKIKTIPFELVPYRRDDAPVRIEHLGARGGGSASGGKGPAGARGGEVER